MEIAGARVLVTGASGGLGQAIAIALHGRGAHVVLTARRTEILDSLCTQLGERVEAIPADLSDGGAVEQLAQTAGEVDILVHNAGMPGTGQIDSFTREQIDRALDVNLRSGMQLSRALL